MCSGSLAPMGINTGVPWNWAIIAVVGVARYSISGKKDSTISLANAMVNPILHSMKVLSKLASV